MGEQIIKQEDEAALINSYRNSLKPNNDELAGRSRRCMRLKVSLIGLEEVK